MGQQVNRSQVQRWHVPALEKVHHSRLGQEWIAHWHSEWSIGAIVDGHCQCSINGLPVSGKRGDLIAIAPQTVHTGALASAGPSQPVSVVMLYVSQEWFVEAGIAPPSSSGFVQSAEIALLARNLPTTSDVEHWLRQALGALTGQPRNVMPTPAARRVLAAFEEGFFAGDASVLALAQRCNVSRERLHRVIRRWAGMSPSHYLRALRVNLAREMLIDGERLATVSAACGFADQAHLTRLFRRSFGYTPGDLMAALAHSAERVLPIRREIGR